jgi:hypothetical protein
MLKSGAGSIFAEKKRITTLSLSALSAVLRHTMPKLLLLYYGMGNMPFFAGVLE